MEREFPIRSEFTRRQMMALSAIGLFAPQLLFASGCRRSYTRPAHYYDLGPARELLLPVQHIRDASLLLFRDERGWAALSTNCSYDGCDLTLQESSLVCSCCGSVFSHEGNNVVGKAESNLPWLALSLEVKDGTDRLIAYSGRIVSSKERFTTPEIERYLSTQKRSGNSGGSTSVKVPEILKGRSDGQLGPMFKDYKPENLDEEFEVEENNTADPLNR